MTPLLTCLFVAVAGLFIYEVFKVFVKLAELKEQNLALITKSRELEEILRGKPDEMTAEPPRRGIEI